MKVENYYKVIETKQRVLQKFYCGKCGKLLFVRGQNVRTVGLDKNREKYFSLATRHHLWGNNSIDSVETDYYCEGCFKEAFDEWMKECEDTYEFETTCEGDILEYEYEQDDSLVCE